MSADLSVLAGGDTPGGDDKGTLLSHGRKVFPTKHPMVKNKDGGISNVKMISVGFDDRTYAIPSMVNGKQLSDDEAEEIARTMGLDKYPSFDSVDEAEAWIQENHGNIDAEGRLNPPKGKK